MPFSELFRVGKMTRADSPQPYGPDDDCFHELVWENGPIVMRGQSSRSKKESNSDNPQSLAPETVEGNNSSSSKMEKFGPMDAMMTDFPSLVPSCPEGLDKYDDFIPLLNFSVDEPLNNDYFSEFLSEFSGVTGNDTSRVNSLVSTEKTSSLSYLSRDVHTSSVTNAISLGKEPISKAFSNAVEPDGHGKRQEFPQHTTPRLGNPGFASNNTSGTRLLTHDEGQPNNNNFGFLNFRSLSRPAAAARVSHKNPGTATSSIPSGAEMSRTKDKGCSVSSRHLNEQNLVNFGNSSSWKDMPPISQPLFGSGKQDRLSSLTLHPTEELPPDNQSHDSCQIITDKIDKLPDLVTTAMRSKVAAGDQKNGEPAGTTSSVCSGSSVEKTSNDPKLDLKRKAHEPGESDSASEEAEEESVGVRKAAPARAGSKRTRAAEVHNMSERRRRDRINEKMRALQELIPNCNKADKASMLDEAIEYLKSLQLQVQMLSMGGGLYMPPPMMLPGGMHHIHGAHMPYFSPMGIGMGMGYGMNMLNMNGDMMQTHAVQVPHYPFYGSQVTRPSNFLGMMGTTSQTFGHPQGKLPVSAPCAPLAVPFSGGYPQNLPMGLNVSGMTGTANGSNLAPPASSMGLMQNVGIQGMPTSNADVLANQSMEQATTESVEPSTIAQKPSPASQQ